MADVAGLASISHQFSMHTARKRFYADGTREAETRNSSTPHCWLLSHWAVIQGEVMLSNLIEPFTVCTRKGALKRLFLLTLALFAFVTAVTRPVHAQGAEPAPTLVAAPATPAAADVKALEDRIADLEAYMNNGARVSKESKVAGAGPGHNAWMMTCAALVLFMTLPGLALFYGGMVRAKNVLSVMAQCGGMAGMVTILWWAFG